MMTAGEDLERQKSAVKELFRSYNKCDEATVAAQVDLLVARLSWASGLCEGEYTELADDDEVRRTQQKRKPKRFP